MPRRTTRVCCTGISSRLTRRLWATILLTGLVWSIGLFFPISEFAGYTIGAMLALAFVTMLLVSLFRFGLMTAFSSLAVLLPLLGFSFYTSLAGQPIFRDVLQEQRPGGSP